jgi:hypothetical protein
MFVVSIRIKNNCLFFFKNDEERICNDQGPEGSVQIGTRARDVTQRTLFVFVNIGKHMMNHCISQELHCGRSILSSIKLKAV